LPEEMPIASLMQPPVTQELARSRALPEAGRRARAVKPWGALAAVCLATFVVLADFMAVGVALPAVQKALDASFPELEWVMEAFVVALACGVLAAGYVAGRTGRRRVFLAGLALLACGSLVAGVAPSAYVLIGARAGQGIGAAMLLVTGAALLAEVFGERQGRAGPSAGIAVWATTTGLAVAVSPLLGGVIVTYLGWRWVFGLAAASSFLALLVAVVAIGPPSLDVRDKSGSDWRGLALFTAGTAILVIGLVRTATTLGGWAQSGVLACFACSGLLLVTFVAVESVSTNPVLDISLFRRRTFAASAVAAFGLSMAVLGPFVFLVLYLSFNLGYSTLSIGSHLLLFSGMTLVLLPLAGLLDRYVPVKFVICAGLALVGTGLWLMSRLPANTTWSDLVPGLVVAGVGLELANPRLAPTAAAAAAAEVRSALSAARASTALRQLGAATGVAVLGSVFATRLTDEISSRVTTFPQLSGQGPQITGLVLDDRTGAAVSSAPALARPALYAVIQTSFTSTMHEIFLIAAGVALVSAVLALSIRSSDVRKPAPAAEAVEMAPALAALRSGERARGQLVPGPSLRPEVQPAETVGRQEPVPLEPLPPGLATITTPPEGAGTPAGTPARPSAGPSGVGASSGPEWLNGGGARADAVAGDLPERRATGSLRVRVTGARDGSPLKAELALVNSEAEVLLRHWTGSDGELVVPDLAPGDYELVVQSLGYRPETMPVAVGPGATRAVEIGLVGVGHIYGAVAGPTGGWLPGVLVTLTDGSGTVVATTKSDNGGSFHFTRVPEGSYTLAAPAWAGAGSPIETGPGSVVGADVVFGPSPDENGQTNMEGRPVP
jgi:hypothetical protein